MKKFLIIFIMLLSFINIKAEDLVTNANNAILMEPITKTIIYEKNVHERVSIASLTKMMGLILIFEQIDAGKIKYTDKVIASANASNMGGSQIWLEKGEEMTVEELLKGIIMASGNDAIVAMAEYVGGSEENFVKMMNDKAKELGLKNTNFVNPTGLDEKNHYSSAYDLGIIAIELMKHPDVFKFTTLYEDYLRKDTDRKFWLVNTNKLLKSYKGVDGLKTGMTDNAGYTMAVTAKRDDLRLLAIVLGEKSGKVRNAETAELLDYGFNNYETEIIKKKGEIVGEVKIDKANPEKINVTVGEDVIILRKKSDTVKEYSSEVKLDDIKLPIKTGDTIGKLLVKDNNSIISQVNLISNANMKKKGFFELWFDIFKSMITGDLI